MTGYGDRPQQVISGAIHYFRTHPGQWRRRLHWLRLMGLDTVETYVPWNLHEPRRAEYVFTGLADIEGFLRCASDEGLRVIVRPGPFICAEWDNGGLPSWLTGRPGIRVRTSDPDYLAEVDRWFAELLPRLVPHQVTHGGPISMMQVENEYGSFGTDQGYLEHLRDLMLRLGVTVPLCTSDGSSDFLLAAGTIPGVAATVNFGSRQHEAFASLRAQRPEDPLFCMEWWNGWFDHWGAPRHTRDAAEASATLADMLATGASVNIYMAHGGTNFGVGAGANYDPPAATWGGTYQPDTTSYDYDAPLDERGEPTPKFHAYREAIAQLRPVPELEDWAEPLLPETALVAAGTAPLSAALDSAPAVQSPFPLTFEELGIAHGIVRYRTSIRGRRSELPLSLEGLADRAHLVIDGKIVHVFDRNAPTSYPLSVPAEGLTIDLVVESMGRVNYGRLVGERKGIAGGVLLGRRDDYGHQELHGWSISAVELPELPRLSWRSAGAAPVAGFQRFTCSVEAPADTYLDMTGWSKGYAWVNGFNLGRYWQIGPQHALYVPAPVLRAGENEVVVLELDGAGHTAPALRPQRTTRAEPRPGEARGGVPSTGGGGGI